MVTLMRDEWTVHQVLALTSCATRPRGLLMLLQRAACRGAILTSSALALLCAGIRWYPEHGLAKRASSASELQLYIGDNEMHVVERPLGLREDIVDAFGPHCDYWLNRPHPACWGTCMAQQTSRPSFQAAPYECFGWRAYADCTIPRESRKRAPQADRGCKDVIVEGQAGYCECGANRKVAIHGCKHKALTCEAECKWGFESLAHHHNRSSRSRAHRHHYLSDQKIPRTVWQLYFDDEGGPEYLAPRLAYFSATWDTQNPEYSHRFFSEGECLRLAEGLDMPDVTLAVKKVMDTGVRAFIADVCRYVVIYTQGGIWADLDTVSMAPIRTWVRPTDELVVGHEYIWDAGKGGLPGDLDFNGEPFEGWRNHLTLIQWTFAAAKGHPSFRHVLLKLAERVLRPGDDQPKDESDLLVWATGPGTFSDGVKDWLSVEMEERGLTDRWPAGVRVLNGAHLGGHAEHVASWCEFTWIFHAYNSVNAEYLIKQDRMESWRSQVGKLRAGDRRRL